MCLNIMRNTLEGKVLYHWHVVLCDESCDAFWSGIASDEGAAAAKTYLRVHGKCDCVTAPRGPFASVSCPQMPIGGVRCNDARSMGGCRARMR